MATFPDPEWFLALGRLMAEQGELFHRLGYVETRFAIRVMPAEDGAGIDDAAGLVMEGYELVRAERLAPAAIEDFDPDFIICGHRPVWDRMLAQIARDGRPELRQTLSSLVLMGEDLWLESIDQLREDKFYRFNQSLQEYFNLASQMPSLA